MCVNMRRRILLIYQSIYERHKGYLLIHGFDGKYFIFMWEVSIHHFFTGDILHVYGYC